MNFEVEIIKELCQVSRLLGEVKKVLEYQSKLLENMVLNEDEKRKVGASNVKAQLASVREALASHPMLKANPEFIGFFDKLMSPLGDAK